MAKRGAEDQITKDNVNLQNENSNESHGPSFATADVMAKRKILMPKGRGTSKADTKIQFSTAAKMFAPTSSDLDTNLKLKALNLMFVNAVTSVDPRALADYRLIIQKYMEYYTSIESSRTETTTSTPAVLPNKNFNVNGATESEKKNPFAGITLGSASIGSKQVEKSVVPVHLESDSDSDSQQKQVRIEGPKFTMSSNPTIKKSPFTFAPNPAKRADDDSSDSEVEIKGPSFTFNKNILDPIFKLGSGSTSLLSAPTSSSNTSAPFSFGEKMQTSATTGLGTTTQSKSKDFEKPLFQFGKKNAEATESVLSLKAGTKSVDTSNSVPTSSLDNNHSAKSFLFGLVGSSALLPLSSIGLGQGSKTMGNTSSPVGVQDKQKSSSTPALEFKSDTNANEAFGISKDAVLFGSTLATPLNSQSFGQSSTVTSTNTVDLMPEEETGADFKPVASLGAKKVDLQSNGEENEQVLFQRRSKLMLLDTKNLENPYKNLGVGELKVLKSENGKSRLLMRADGGLRVLLNVSLLEDITYSTFGNGSLVRVPAVSSNGVFETYVLKVKSSTDGKELCDTLNQAKTVSNAEHDGSR